MARIRIMSDLHLESGRFNLRPADEDVLVLAGDIGIHDTGACWAVDYAVRHGVPVIMIAGNHEFYRTRRRTQHTVDSTLVALRGIADNIPLFWFLENDEAVVAGVRFVGATLWTDFALDGNQPLAMWQAGRGMNDYIVIERNDRERFTPDHALDIHAASVADLRRRLAARSALPTVVVTHHLPSPRSLDSRYANSVLNPAYASRLDDLVDQSGAALWIHGHTHVSLDYAIGATRIICNPRGYCGYELNPDFDRALIVDVETPL